VLALIVFMCLCISRLYRSARSFGTCLMSEIADFTTLFARDWPAYFRADRMEAFCTRSAAALSATERRSVS